MISVHVPVMVEEVLNLLNPRPGARIVDATTGHGGHAEKILERLGPDGELIGLDRDSGMLEQAAKRLERFGSAARLVHARLAFLRDVVRGTGNETVDGVLMDLGVCSEHLDDPSRGFTFKDAGEDVPLDMRMDTTQGETAAELIENLDDERLVELMRAADVPAPRRVVAAIKENSPIRTAQDLLTALRGVRLPRRRHNPATLVFQALRIAVNDEFGELESGLEAALEVLAPGGRLAVLSYHSGEDRRVKDFLRREQLGCICPPDLPVCGCGRSPRIRILAKGQGPGEEEIRANPRARSARLRGGERC